MTSTLSQYRYLLLVALAFPCATYCATCSFSNLHPQSTGAYLTLGDSDRVDTPYATSATVAYKSTAHFECDTSRSTQVARVLNSEGTKVVAKATMYSMLDCQAINMMSLEPFTYGSPYGDLDFPTTSAGNTQLQEKSTRLFVLNAGYNGTVVWKIQGSESMEWTSIYTGEFFDSGGVVDEDSSSPFSFLIRCETESGTVIASSSSITISLADSQMAIHINLIGLSGSEEILVVRGCGTPGSNCNDCPSSEALAGWVIATIVFACILVIAFLVATVWWLKCRKPKPTEGSQQPSPQGSMHSPPVYTQSTLPAYTAGDIPTAVPVVQATAVGQQEFTKSELPHP